MIHSLNHSSEEVRNPNHEITGVGLSSKKPQKIRLKSTMNRNVTAVMFVVLFAIVGVKLIFSSLAASQTTTKVWSTDADWNSGLLSNVSVDNNEVSLTAPISVDLALNKHAVASSVQSGGNYAATNAFDGSLSSRWSSNFSSPQWIYVDLGGSYSVNRVVLHWERAYAKAYRIQVSNNMTSWTTIYSTKNGKGDTSRLTNLSGVGRYVRMYAIRRGTPWGDSLWEMAVYGSPSPTHQRTGSITVGYTAPTIVDWASFVPQSMLPTGTAISYQFRTSSNSKTWSAWNSNITELSSGKYIQIEAILSSTSLTATPQLTKLTLGYSTIVSTPTVTISASSRSITAGQATTLTWSSANTTACTASGSWSGSRATSGSATTGVLASTSTYELACKGIGGTATATTTINVSAVVTTTGGTTPSSCSNPFVSSVFCMPITNATVDAGTNGYPNSATLVSDFNKEVTESGYNVGVNNGSYGIPIYRVGSSQALVTVKADCTTTSDYTTSLQAPIPNGAVPATGTDHSIIIYQASTNKEWEFWNFQTTGTDTYEACDGGEMSNVSTSNGVFPLSGSQLSSSGIDYMATLITETDVQAGAINHAIPVADMSCDGFIAPARSNYDCGGGVVPYGQYFRFPPGMAMPSGLAPLAQMIFKAIQNYGMVTVDTGGAIQVGAEDPAGWYMTTGTPTTTVDPITAAMDGQPEYEVIASLPWSQLQAVNEP
jgi:hypothetical protein